jgi:hypothetical protein
LGAELFVPVGAAAWLSCSTLSRYVEVAGGGVQPPSAAPLRSLRVSKVKTPTLILSGFAGIEDKVKGFGSTTSLQNWPWRSAGGV